MANSHATQPHHPKPNVQRAAHPLNGAMSRSLASSQGAQARGLASRSRKRCSLRAFSASVSAPESSHLSWVSLWRGGRHLGWCGEAMSTIGTHHWSFRFVGGTDRESQEDSPDIRRTLAGASPGITFGLLGALPAGPQHPTSSFKHPKAGQSHPKQRSALYLDISLQAQLYKQNRLETPGRLTGHTWETPGSASSRAS